MSRPRAQSDALKTPHSVSLKVLRLSRPSLRYQHTLPQQSPDAAIRVNSQAALAFPSDQDESFIISPVLTLPATFGITHVGEQFRCTLCANNELSIDDSRTITDVNIVAEMQTPGQSKALPLDVDGEVASNAPIALKAGETLQRVVVHDLKEEGTHLLGVTVTYVENDKLRTFRKLYQFAARNLLSVKTKTKVMPTRSPAEVTTYALEAQLENLSDNSIILQAVDINAKPYIEPFSLNTWEASAAHGKREHPMLNPGDVLQVAYLLKEKANAEKPDDSRDNRLPLAQMSISWKSGMGENGHLSTGWLTARRRQ